jgi:hypothetical protein
LLSADWGQFDSVQVGSTRRRWSFFVLLGVGHPKTLQVIVNILDFRMNLQTAVDTPPFLCSYNLGSETCPPERKKKDSW